MHIKVIKLSEKNESLGQEFMRFLKKNFFFDEKPVGRGCAKKIPDVFTTPGTYIPSKSILHFLSVLQELSQTDVSERVLQQAQD